MVNNSKRVSAFSPLLVCSEHLTDIHLKTAKIKPLAMHPILSKASTRTSCADMMTRKGNNGQVVIQVYMQQGIQFALRSLGRNLFYQFRPRGFLEMVNDQTGSVRVVCSRMLS